ncbi:MAG: hypothetical protein RR825_04825 [Ruthenibacterium sp.]
MNFDNTGGMVFRRTMNRGKQITLPQCVIRQCGIQSGDALDIITMQGGNGFLVQKPYNRCQICGETECLRNNAHLCLCVRCLEQFKQEVITDE